MAKILIFFHFTISGLVWLTSLVLPKFRAEIKISKVAYQRISAARFLVWSQSREADFPADLLFFTSFQQFYSDGLVFLDDSNNLEVQFSKHNIPTINKNFFSIKRLFLIDTSILRVMLLSSRHENNFNVLKYTEAFRITKSTLQRKYQIDDWKSQTVHLKVELIIKSFLTYYRTVLFAGLLKECETFVAVDQGYSPIAEVSRVLRSRYRNFFVVTNSHRYTKYLITKYGHNNCDQHPWAISDSLIATELAKLIDDRELKVRTQSLKAEVENCYASGSWFKEVACSNEDHSKQFNAKNPGKISVSVFPHLFWDGTGFYGRDAFYDYFDWFSQLVYFMKPFEYRVHWIIKLHPSHQVKNQSGCFGFREVEILSQIFKEKIPDLTVIYPSDRIDAISVIKQSDLVLSVRGTVLLESVLFEVPALGCGTGRYDNLEDVINISRTQDDYWNRLTQLITDPIALKKEKDRIRCVEVRRKIIAYCSALYLERPITFKSWAIDYIDDKKTLISDACAEKNSAAFVQDVGQFCRFVSSNETVMIDETEK